MRTSLSCEFCRKSKIKCVNTGKPPCQKCQKSDIVGCVLSRPRNRLSKGPVRRIQGTDRPASGSQSVNDPEWNGPSHSVPASEIPERTVQPEISDSGEGWDEARIDGHLTCLTTSVIVKTLHVFAKKYPELAILHLPTFIIAFQSSCPDESKTLLAAILAVIRSELLRLSPLGVDSLLAREQYAFYAREMLSKSAFQPPKTQVAQALLVMALYEWGFHQFHRAWVYCGIAIRIMQAVNSLRIAPYPLDSTLPVDRDSVSVAIENRTLWACFIMDRMISSGTYNPPMLPMSEMEKLKVSRPLNDVEFAFSPNMTAQLNSIDQGLAIPNHVHGVILDITQSFEILVAGFDIWAKVMTFIFNDGRRAPGMCAPENCPWVPGSPWWKARSQLETWRANQHHRLHYPDSTVAVHMTLGYGESFTYLNLLYYLCTLMLHREYFPFMPTAESIPSGPVEHPMLEAEAPEAWWDGSAFELFAAAEYISKLLHDASECGVDLLTPFVGFCAFSAAYMNLYIFRFPQMNLGRSLHAEQNLRFCLAYLEDFRHVWKLGDHWITTVNHASLLYQRAVVNRSRYQGKSRVDFDVLHQSIHEFRVIDRSDQHMQEIEGAEREAASSTRRLSPVVTSGSDPLDLHMPLSNLLAEVSTHAHERGVWSHWWPNLDEINLALFQDN